MSKRKNSKQDDKALKTILLLTALVNLIKALIDLITKIIDRLGG